MIQHNMLPAEAWVSCCQVVNRLIPRLLPHLIEVLYKQTLKQETNTLSWTVHHIGPARLVRGFLQPVNTGLQALLPWLCFNTIILSYQAGIHS